MKKLTYKVTCVQESKQIKSKKVKIPEHKKENKMIKNG